MPRPLVHIVEDDEALRDSLSFLLGSAEMDVRTYSSADAFVAAGPPQEGGCIVSDVRMPGMSGIDMLRTLKARNNALPVIIITGHGDIAMAVEAMKHGAVDFFEKPFDDEKFLAAIKAAFDRSASPQSGQAGQEILERIESLSARERQVLEGLVAGLPNKTIAFDLGISSRTVEVYRANVMAKMHARSLSELVRMAISAGLAG